MIITILIAQEVPLNKGKMKMLQIYMDRAMFKFLWYIYITEYPSTVKKGQFKGIDRGRGSWCYNAQN